MEKGAGHSWQVMDGWDDHCLSSASQRGTYEIEIRKQRYRDTESKDEAMPD